MDGLTMAKITNHERRITVLEGIGYVDSFSGAQRIVRAGIAPTVFTIGDQISCYKATGVTAAASGGGITGASVVFATFINKVGKSDPGIYVFVYDGANWYLEDDAVLIAAYGIAVVGVPANGSTVTITVAADLITWDVIGHDQDVFRAWKNGAKIYYTCVDEPVLNELVFELTGTTFNQVGYISTAYDSATTSVGMAIGADAAATYIRDDESDTADGVHKHTMTLQMHDCYEDVQFDNTEALYYCEAALAPGTYYFTLLAGYDAAYGGGKSYQFTTTQEVPTGGVLMFPWGYNVQASTIKVSSYATKTDAAAIETLDVIEGSGGTQLIGCNHTHRIRYGSNNWVNSAMRQYLNSAAAVNTYWASKTNFDRPPSWVGTLNGFMRGLDPEFLKVIGESRKIVNLNTIKTLDDANKYVDADDQGIVAAATRKGVRVTKDIFFLPSYTEVYCGKLSVDDRGINRSVSIGRAYSYYKRLAAAPTTGELPGRIKYRAGTARYWWVRSATPSNAGYVIIVDPSGAYYSGIASGTYGSAPACNIM